MPCIFTTMTLSPSSESATHLGHYGLIAGAFDELDISDLIDELLPKKSGRNIPHSTLIKAMCINGLGFIERRLYILDSRSLITRSVGSSSDHYIAVFVFLVSRQLKGICLAVLLQKIWLLYRIIENIHNKGSLSFSSPKNWYRKVTILALKCKGKIFATQPNLGTKVEKSLKLKVS